MKCLREQERAHHLHVKRWWKSVMVHSTVTSLRVRTHLQLNSSCPSLLSKLTFKSHGLFKMLEDELLSCYMQSFVQGLSIWHYINRGKKLRNVINSINGFRWLKYTYCVWPTLKNVNASLKFSKFFSFMINRCVLERLYKFWFPCN